MEERLYIIKQDELDCIKSELQEIKALKVGRTPMFVTAPRAEPSGRRTREM